ncbi:transporter [Pontibacter pamirensis]|uniref:transporter n=1 Tax=Pontibacter pamirensis TaxID=2562824 RepID=UPI00138A010A|nr:transporter [Pontibacter pamirensis]
MKPFTKQSIRLKWLVTPLLIFILIQQGYCQGEVPEFETDRPDQAEAASLVPRKMIQLETGLYFQKDIQMGVEKELKAYPSALTRYGVVDWLELRVQSALRDSVIESPRRFRTSGFAPLTVGAKVKLWDEQGLRPQAAFMTMVTLPVGSRHLRPDNPDPLFRLLLKNSLTEKLSLSYNVVYGWVDGDLLKGYAVSLGYGISDRFTVYGEVFGDKQQGDKAKHSVDGGLLFMILPNLQFDVAAGRALNEAATDFFITTGLSLRLPR